MWEWLENLQNKDPETKRLFLILGTGTIMVIVVFLWLFLGLRWEYGAFPSQEKDVEGRQQAAVQKQSNAVSQRLSRLFRGIEEDYLAVKEKISDVFAGFLQNEQEITEPSPSLPSPLPPGQSPPLKLPETD